MTDRTLITPESGAIVIEGCSIFNHPRIRGRYRSSHLCRLSPALYALTWLPIRDHSEGPVLDVTAYDYARSHRGAYIRWVPPEVKQLRGKARQAPEKRSTISARRSAKQGYSTARRSTHPSEMGFVTPPGGAIREKSAQFRTPPGGYNLGNTTSKGVS